MSRKTIRILLIFLLINLTKNQIESAPIIGLLLGQNNQNYQPPINDGANNSNNNQTTTTVNPISNSTTSDGTIDRNNIQPSDYVSNSQFDQVIARVRNQSLTYAPGNYISDDIPLDELLRILNSTENNSTTLNIPIESEEDVTTINTISNSEMTSSETSTVEPMTTTIDDENNSNNNQPTTTVIPTTTTLDAENGNDNNELTSTVNPILNSTTSDVTIDRNNIQPSDYVSNTQFDQVIARVRNQSLTYAPGNYISDDIPLDELLRILNSTENNSTTLNIPIESEEDVTTINTISNSEMTSSETSTVEPNSINLTIGEENDRDNNELTTTVNPILNSTISNVTNHRNNIQPSDYVSDTEFDQVIARTRDQSLTYSPGNYISDDIPLGELLKILESIDKHSRAISVRSDSERPTTLRTIVQEEECPICYEPLKNQAQRWTRCGHKFHKSCLEKYIRSKRYFLWFNNAACPVCRNRHF